MSNQKLEENNKNVGIHKKNKNLDEILSKGGGVNESTILGNKYEPQGTVLIKRKMKYTEVILFDQIRNPETKKIEKIRSGNEKIFEGKIFTVVGVTPTKDFLILWNNNGTPDHATINKRDIEYYSPIKNEDGLLIPINLTSIQEKSYIKKARKNKLHNKEISQLLASQKYDDINKLWNVLIKKYD